MICIPALSTHLYNYTHSQDNFVPAFSLLKLALSNQMCGVTPRNPSKQTFKYMRVSKSPAWSASGNNTVHLNVSYASSRSVLRETKGMSDSCCRKSSHRGILESYRWRPFYSLRGYVTLGAVTFGSVKTLVRILHVFVAALRRDPYSQALFGVFQKKKDGHCPWQSRANFLEAVP